MLKMHKFTFIIFKCIMLYIKYMFIAALLISKTVLSCMTAPLYLLDINYLFHLHLTTGSHNSISYKHDYYIHCTNGVMQYWSFYDCLIPLSLIFARISFFFFKVE